MLVLMTMGLGLTAISAMAYFTWQGMVGQAVHEPVSVTEASAARSWPVYMVDEPTMRLTGHETNRSIVEAR